MSRRTTTNVRPALAAFDFDNPARLAATVHAADNGCTLRAGIDPGITGALAVLVYRGTEVVGGGVWDLPTMPDPTATGRKSRQALDLRMLYSWLRALAPATIVLERFLAFSAARSKALHAGADKTSGPGEYANSRLAGTVGEIRGVLAAAAVETPLVRLQDPTPQQWRKRLGLSSSDKEYLRQQAIRLHPQIAHRLTAKAHHNRAEALLLADYAAIAER